MNDKAQGKHHRAATSIGVDGCKGGWFFVKVDSRGVFSWDVVEKLEELVCAAFEGDRICVDIPIGLPNGPGERWCDKLARKRLGTPRGSSVFPAPARETLEATDNYERAKQINRQVLDKAISRQTFAICPKIKEVDGLLRRSGKARGLVYEVHPELCFRVLADRRMSHNKKTSDGYKERLAVLRELSPEAETVVQSASEDRSGKFDRDDVVDAAVAALTAAASELQSLPDDPPADSYGLPMRMVYANRAGLDRAPWRGSSAGRVPASRAGPAIAAGSVQVLDPSWEGSPPRLSPAPRLRALAGVDVALLSNGKAGVEPLFDHLEVLLRERWNVAAVERATKGNYSAPAEPELVRRLARRRLVVTGVGD